MVLDRFQVFLITIEKSIDDKRLRSMYCEVFGGVAGAPFSMESVRTWNHDFVPFAAGCLDNRYL